jgi:DNA helicase-2/ATP-dependent DNA helicase PcrA
VEAANHIIANNRGQIPKTVWTQNEKGNKIKLYRAITDNEEGQFVASSIHETHLREHTPHDQFAVLYRTNAQSRALEEALRKLNVPYRIYGGLSFYHRKEIKDLLAYIRVVINPADEEALKRIINYPARGIGKTTLDKLFVAASDNDISLWEVLENIESLGLGLGVGIRAKIEDFRFMMLRFQGALMNANAYDLATEIAQNSGLLQDLYTDKSPEGVSRYENILELLNGIKEFADREENLPDGRPILPAFMEDVALLTDADETDDDNIPKVSLMTIHAAKGLEFQEVFVVGLEDSLFPNQQNMHSRAEMEEERRLFYVAITRAMKQLSISYSTTRYRYGSLVHSEASPFISELNQEYLEPVASRRPGAGGAPDPFRRNISSTFSIPAHSRLRKVSDVSKTPSNANLAADYKVGMLVKHNRFGQGKIIGIDGPAGQKTATVLFNESGEKRLLLKFAKLEIVQ